MIMVSLAVVIAALGGLVGDWWFTRARIYEVGDRKSTRLNSSHRL